MSTSTQNSALVREAVAAFNRRDFEVIPRIFAENVEFWESPEWPNAGVYRGREAFAGYFSRLISNIDGLQGEVVSTREAGDRVLAELRTFGNDKQTGQPVELTFTSIYTFNGGKCVRLDGFLDRQRAEEAWRETDGEQA